MPDAVFYVLQFTRAEDGAGYAAGSEEPAWKPNAEDTELYFGLPGTYLWTVIAYSDPVNEAGRPERPRVFELGKP